MPEYPYDLSRTFDFRKAGIPEHYIRVRAELRTKAPYANDLTSNELNALAEAVFWIDHAASIAADEIKRSPWKKQLQTLEPPTKSKRHLSEWAHFRDRQTCITQCEMARNAIFQGCWGTAIESALNAGQLIGHSKRANRRQPIGARAAHPTTIRAQRNMTTILERASFYRSSRNWGLNRIAKRIAEEHPNERGFSYENIRKVLRADKAWENKI
jgi:hypothetical protein